MSVPQVLYRMCVCVCVWERERESLLGTINPSREVQGVSLSLSLRENIFAKKKIPPDSQQQRYGKCLVGTDVYLFLFSSSVLN